jgi:aminopeptidase N
VDREPDRAVGLTRSPRLRPRIDSGDPYLPGHGDPSYAVEAYEIDLDYRVSSNHLDGRAQLTVVALEDLDRLSLDLTGLGVGKVTVDGRRPAKYAHRGGKLTIQLVEAVPAGQRLTLSIRYAGQPRPLRSTWGTVGWEELSDGVIVAGQPAGAPSWFPCNDRPDNKATYLLTVTTESAYVVVANGRLVDQRSGASRTTWFFEQTQPMASYLATVQIGHYETHRLARSPVPQHLVVPQRIRAAAAVDFGRQHDMVDYFAEVFGPYPFDSYVVVVTDDQLEIPLEAQGVSIFGANHVDGERRWERLVAHELAHQWFGNSLTLGQWQDIWLHEGFACYAEWLWSEQVGDASADDHARRCHRRLSGLDQDLVVADPGPDLMFDDRLYKRGALTLHALRITLGEETFFDWLRDWVAGHRLGTVSTAQLTEEVSRRGDVTELLRQWLWLPGLPALPTARG